MRLPDQVERELKVIEKYLAELPGQHAGTPRLRALRFAIEQAIKDALWSPDA